MLPPWVPPTVSQAQEGSSREWTVYLEVSMPMPNEVMKQNQERARKRDTALAPGWVRGQPFQPPNQSWVPLFLGNLEGLLEEVTLNLGAASRAFQQSKRGGGNPGDPLSSYYQILTEHQPSTRCLSQTPPRMCFGQLSASNPSSFWPSMGRRFL